MTAGRPPAPTALKLIRGTARADRAKANEPAPATLEVGTKPPAWLKGVRRQRAWVELSELLRGQRLLTVLDAAALALLVDAYGDYLEASDLLNGLSCAHCGEPMSSRRECTAIASIDVDVDEDDDQPLVGQPHGGAIKGEKADQVTAILVRLPHEPGRRLYTTRTQTGSLMIRPHPAVAIREKAWTRMATMLGRFGMDPSSRSKVTAGGGEPDEMDDLLDGLG